MQKEHKKISNNINFWCWFTLFIKNQWSKSGDQDSLMLAGLEAWEKCLITDTTRWLENFEPRLQARLKKEYFLEPPDFRQYSIDET